MVTGSHGAITKEYLKETWIPKALRRFHYDNKFQFALHTVVIHSRFSKWNSSILIRTAEAHNSQKTRTFYQIYHSTWVGSRDYECLFDDDSCSYIVRGTTIIPRKPTGAKAISFYIWLLLCPINMVHTHVFFFFCPHRKLHCKSKYGFTAH